MQHHIVWGKVESDDSFGTSPELSAQVSKNTARRPGGQGALEGVVFQNESSGSASCSHTSSASGQLYSRNSQRAAPPVSSAVRAALATLRDGASPSGPPRRREGGQDADSDFFDDGAAEGGLAAAMSQLEEAAQRKLVSQLLADGGPEIQTLSEFWSIGTAAHGTSACRPCHYVHTLSGCVNGANCEFCHLPHAKKTRPRPCKSRRVQTRRFGLVLEEIHLQQPVRFLAALRELAAESEQVRALLEGALLSAGSSQPPGGVGRLAGQKKHILSL
mmetsp:Transcript_30306/g.86499  ORF Transcript_30306/g.86499 Transcript_30306/m.86499 type:complete len:274 (+) Transcript_30306:91-912(+)